MVVPAARPAALVVRRGEGVAAVLAGAWRNPPPPLAVAADRLDDVVPCLEETGAGSLAWWRLRHADPRASAVVRRLRQVYRCTVLHTACHEEQLRRLLPALRGAGVEPVLLKGWSAARLYPEAGLRPCGDIDLCVAPAQMPAAVAALAALGRQAVGVDLHRGVPELEDRPWEEVYRRSRLLPLGDIGVRGLGAEDQLRHLCLHLLGHGAWRPLWLCDVAAALESAPADFDWDYFLSGGRRCRAWALCVLGLARRLLGARPLPPAVAARADEPPRWLRTDVLTLWGLGAASNDQNVPGPFAQCARTARGIWQGVRSRWPNPTRGAFRLRLSPHTRLPCRLIQLGAFLARGCEFVTKHFSWGRAAAGAAPHPFSIHLTSMR